MLKNLILNDLVATVKNNKSIFDKYEERLEVESRKLSKISKEENKNRVLSVSKRYRGLGFLSVKEYLDEMIRDFSFDNQVDLYALAMYTYFSININKKISKDYLDDIYKVFVTNLTSFSREYNYNTKSFKFDPSIQGNNWSGMSHTSLISQIKKISSSKEIKEMVNWVIQNELQLPKSFISSVKRELKKNVEGLGRLDNKFHLKIFKNKLPKLEKLSKSRVKGMLTDLEVNNKLDRLEKKTTQILYFKALLEKYGLEAFLENKLGMLSLFNNRIMLERGVLEHLNEDKRQILAEPSFQEIIKKSFFIMNKISI